jgi:hypothetical protein
MTSCCRTASFASCACCSALCLYQALIPWKDRGGKSLSSCCNCCSCCRCYLLTPNSIYHARIVSSCSSNWCNRSQSAPDRSSLQIHRRLSVSRNLDDNKSSKKTVAKIRRARISRCEHRTVTKHASRCRTVIERANQCRTITEAHHEC